jgi:hypothetical protein
MLRFYHAILRVILRGGRKPHGRAIHYGKRGKAAIV